MIRMLNHTYSESMFMISEYLLIYHESLVI